VALYLRERIRSEGWPELWLLRHVAKADAAMCADRRGRGLHRLRVEETCARLELPKKPPPPTRKTKRERELEKLGAHAEALRALADKIERGGPVRPR
jgi:hypothetical protein